MRILFSPIGTADPITQLGDGPMLHIVRHKSPEKICLFLSPAMAKHQREDQRYTKAVEMLSESLGRSKPEVEIIESTWEEVFRFDYYIDEFESLLTEYCSESNEVLVNVSSGTAGMQQALVALGAFGRLDLELLQVTTPRKGINKRDDREAVEGYDLDFMWQLNLVTEDPNSCRIVSVETPNFSERLLKEKALRLVQSYEYHAAYELVSQSNAVSVEAKDLIQAAAHRLYLKGQLPAKVFGGTELGYKSNDLLVEYLYMMEVRLKQANWADFVRSMTPAFTEAMKLVLGSYIHESRYLKSDKNGKTTELLDIEKIQKDEGLFKIFEDCYWIGGCDHSVYISSEYYWWLVQAFCEDEHKKDAVQKLRTVESKCRNKVAHTIRDTSKQRLEKDCGLTLERIMQYLFELHGNAKPGMYDRINDAIAKAMS